MPKSGTQGGDEAERDVPRRQDGGYGDDQGTRIGTPDQGAPREAGGRGPTGTGPSSEPVKEGIEGAIFEDEPDRSEQSEGRTGAGSEAARGREAAGGGHDREHQSGYGGSQAEPKRSSDQREPLKPD